MCNTLNILLHCLSLGLERKLNFFGPVATAEFSKFAALNMSANLENSAVAMEEGNGNPLQYSCLENPMGRGA